MVAIGGSTAAASTGDSGVAALARCIAVVVGGTTADTSTGGAGFDALALCTAVVAGGSTAVTSVRGTGFGSGRSAADVTSLLLAGCAVSLARCAGVVDRCISGAATGLAAWALDPATGGADALRCTGAAPLGEAGD
jgi:hypothetical protein